MNKQIYILILLFCTQAAFADGKIVKWVDKQGVTHYGDRPPSYEESKSNQEMNKQGVVTKKNELATPKDTAQDLQQQQQARKDKVLMDSYTSANEIDLARDRSLEMNKAALTSLAAQKQSLVARITRNNETTANFKKRNKPLPVNLDTEFKSALAQSARIDKQVADNKLAMAQTRKNYAEDKARYLILKQPAVTNDVSSAAAATETTGDITTAAEATSIDKIYSEKK